MLKKFVWSKKRFGMVNIKKTVRYLESASKTDFVGPKKSSKIALIQTFFLFLPDASHQLICQADLKEIAKKKTTLFYKCSHGDSSYHVRFVRKALSDAIYFFGFSFLFFSI
jgi:hypothetical protein